jgi:acetyl-CoA carboxylase biotin carboxyl carrier protein
MSIDEIKDLIRVVQETGIAELEVQRGENKVRIRRANATALDIVAPVVPVSMPAATPITQLHSGNPGGAIQTAAQPGGFEPNSDGDARNLTVKSPIVGTYYDSPSPDAPPFVKVGDHVSPKQVLCIIESMKLMNEIEADVAGTIAAKFVENGRPVEYGESLFSIRPQ